MIVGIDLGTTNSLITTWKDGDLILFKDNSGKDMLPSAVGLDEYGNIMVGEAARQRRVSHPNLTATEFKREMGTTTKYRLGNKLFSPEELSALVLERLVNNVRLQTGEFIDEVIISVPAYFNNKQREATRAAAEIAGLKVKRFINEPSAAILYHQWKCANANPSGLYMVIDFGGGTLDVSIVDCFENIVEIIAVAGDNHLGGKDFDRCIAEDFCMQNNMYFDTLPIAVQENVIRQAENVKKRLTTDATATMSVYIDDVHYEVTYDSKTLLHAISQVLTKVHDVMNDALRSVSLMPDDITDVVLVGGSCRMPIVQKYISALFQREITALDDCDRLVALGVGVLSGIIQRDDDVKDIVMTDVCPFSLGVASLSNDKLITSVIIPKNSILPISKHHTYSGVEKFQKRIDFTIYQGEHLEPEKNTKIGSCTILPKADEKGDTTVDVTFTYDIDGLLRIELKDMNSSVVEEHFIWGENQSLSSEEIQRIKDNFKNNKRIALNDEESKNLLAWAERLYVQSNSELKETLASIILNIQSLMESNNHALLRRAKSQYAKQLLEIEMYLNRNYFDDEIVLSELSDDTDS